MQKQKTVFVLTGLNFGYGCFSETNNERDHPRKFQVREKSGTYLILFHLGPNMWIFSTPDVPETLRNGR